MSSLCLEPCVPPLWAPSGHAQTILAHLIPSAPLVPREQLKGAHVEIPLPDGDRLVAKHIPGSGDTVLYIFHGIASNISADYMQRTAALGHKLKADVYLVNHRGCGEGRGLAKRPYHSGRAEDLSEAIQLGRKRHPNKRHVAIGFSLSASALLNLLSGRRGEVLPDAAIAVNGPIYLEGASQLLGKGLNRIYDQRFLLECRYLVWEMQRKGMLDRKYDIPWISTLREFDEIYTSPASGFKDRADYYTSCSTKEHLAKIQVPTILLTAKDDPFIDARDYAEAQLSPHVRLHIEEFGGHMGYLSSRKTPLGTTRWLDYALWESLKSV